MPKNKDLDLKVGTRLTLWMKAMGLTDGKLAKLVGSAAPTVATWRVGTRPTKQWLGGLSQVTGWDWTKPETIAALTDEQILEQVKTVRSADEVEKSLQKPARKPRTVAEAAEVPSEVLTFGSFAGLTRARDAIREVLTTGRVLNPADAADQLVLNLVDEALTSEVSRRANEDADFKSATEIRNLVLGHKNPDALLAFLRTNVDPKIMKDVERTLPGVSASA